VMARGSLLETEHWIERAAASGCIRPASSTQSVNSVGS
jgi:hypothetical protein